MIDLTGKKFGLLTVVQRVENKVLPSGRSVPLWLCKCDCGNECIVSAHELIAHDTNSCGCIRKERKKITTRNMEKDGQSYTVYG